MRWQGAFHSICLQSTVLYSPQEMFSSAKTCLPFTNWIRAFHDSKVLSYKLCSPPPSIIQVGNIPFCGFSWTPAQHQVQIEKVPPANFSIGRPTVLSTEPLFQARNSDVSPWAHKWRSSLHFYPQASHIKNPSVVAACPDPQLRCSASSACANLAISRAKSQRESLWSWIFQCTTLPRLHS